MPKYGCWRGHIIVSLETFITIRILTIAAILAVFHHALSRATEGSFFPRPDVKLAQDCGQQNYTRGPG
jgi:hypothetical protein